MTREGFSLERKTFAVGVSTVLPYHLALVERYA